MRHATGYLESKYSEILCSGLHKTGGGGYSGHRHAGVSGHYTAWATLS